ncbi:MAG TPA: hypothetical protein VK809_05475 [Bacteroidia bacterium]|jgi:hypothetical protein|nr:hypothetical protein [Bacteroidia bacterium]
MNTNKFQPFFDGYFQAVIASIVSLLALIIISIGVLDWPLFGFVLVVFIGAILHFLFLLGIYIVVFPLLSSMDSKGPLSTFRTFMDRYIPYFAIPFALLFGLLWMGGDLNKFFTFVMLDFLFTCYIGLYYYVKNKCRLNEQA